MHTGYYVGFFLAALANYFLGARYGWRVMFAIGGFPALLVGFIRYGVTDSARWRSKAEQMKKWSVSHPLKILFSREYRWRTSAATRLGRQELGHCGVARDQFRSQTHAHHSTKKN